MTTEPETTTGFDPEVATALAAESNPTGPSDVLARFLATPAPKLLLSDVRLYHKNPRKGKVDVIAASLIKHGQYKPIVVNKGTHTGRKNEVLAGNHTVKALRELHRDHPDDPTWKTVLVHMIDVDDDQAARIVATDNRTADLGGYDDEVLAELLRDIPDLTGTGYTDEDLAKLLGTNITEGDADTNESPHVFGVIVECDTEQQQITLLDQLDGEGFVVRALM
jgi:hypothetical protein